MALIVNLKQRILDFDIVIKINFKANSLKLFGIIFYKN